MNRESTFPLFIVVPDARPNTRSRFLSNASNTDIEDLVDFLFRLRGLVAVKHVNSTRDVRNLSLATSYIQSAPLNQSEWGLWRHESRCIPRNVTFYKVLENPFHTLTLPRKLRYVVDFFRAIPSHDCLPCLKTQFDPMCLPCAYRVELLKRRQT